MALCLLFFARGTPRLGHHSCFMAACTAWLARSCSPQVANFGLTKLLRLCSDEQYRAGRVGTKGFLASFPGLDGWQLSAGMIPRPAGRRGSTCVDRQPSPLQTLEGTLNVGISQPANGTSHKLVQEGGELPCGRSWPG